MQEFSAEGCATFRSHHTPEKAAERLRAGFRYRLAESNGELAGLIGTRDNTHLHHLFIAPAFQGQGLGRRLWELEKAECIQAGTRVFTVNASLNAIPVYERFGFTVVSPTQDVGGVQFVPMKMILG